MKKTKLIVIAGVLAATTIIATATAFAAASAAEPSGTAAGGSRPVFTDTLKTALDTLVTAGTITSEQETTVLNALQPQAPADGTAPDGTAPDGTVPDGTAPDGTAPDGTAPDGARPDGARPDGARPDGARPENGRQDHMTSALDALVTAGTITADQETAIADALRNAAPHDADSCKTALDALVTAGTINADQETAVLTALQPQAPAGGTAPDGTAPDGTRPENGRQDHMTSALDALVTAGTITADQETAILTAIHDAMPAAPADSGFTCGSRGFGSPGHDSGPGKGCPPTADSTSTNS
jgi:polyhydroxyalkanoate synthesis regulator phasin